MFDPACAVNRMDAGSVLFKARYKTVRYKTVTALSAIVTNEIQDDWKGKWLEKVFLFSAYLLSTLDNTFCTVRFFTLEKMSLYRCTIIMIKLQPTQALCITPALFLSASNPI